MAPVIDVHADQGIMEPKYCARRFSNQWSRNVNDNTLSTYGGARHANRDFLGSMHLGHGQHHIRPG